MKPTIPLSLLVLTGLHAAAVAQPRPADRMLAAGCAGCHGPRGEGAGAMPAIAGRTPQALASELRRFRDGRRPATVMHQIVRGYSDDEIERLAAHFAAWPAAR